jgi:hypothetical protein
MWNLRQIFGQQLVGAALVGMFSFALCSNAAIAMFCDTDSCCCHQNVGHAELDTPPCTCCSASGLCQIQQDTIRHDTFDSRSLLPTALLTQTKPKISPEVIASLSKPIDRSQGPPQLRFLRTVILLI